MELNLSSVLLLLFSFSFNIQLTSAVKGAVELDSFTFDKIIANHRVVLVKFDEKYPYGAKHDQFKKFVEELSQNRNLLIAEVGVADYGEKDNADLAERFGVKKEDFPAYRLFLNGKINEPIKHEGGPDAEDLKRLIATKADLYIGLAGCVKAYDDLATEFINARGEKRTAVIEKARLSQEKLDNPADRYSATVYIKLMERILEKGSEYIDTELLRVEKLLAGKMNPAKQQELKIRMSILSSFKMARDRDEL